jgi:hypothetical protein
MHMDVQRTDVSEQLPRRVVRKETRPKPQNWRRNTYFSQESCYISPRAPIKNESRSIRWKQAVIQLLGEEFYADFQITVIHVNHEN